jgi:protein-tyrosine-phosphatase
MAAALATALFARENIKITVSSAGVSASRSSPASKNAIRAMELEKIDLSAHQSQPANAALLQNAALVLTMTRAHLSHVKTACPTANAYTLGEYAGSLMDIADPFGGSLDEYKTCATQIKKLLDECVEKLRKEVLR